VSTLCPKQREQCSVVTFLGVTKENELFGKKYLLVEFVISAVYHMIPQNFVKKQINIAHPTHTPDPDRFALEVNGKESGQVLKMRVL